MNRFRRAELRKANKFLREAQSSINEVLDDGPDAAEKMDAESAKLLLEAIEDLKDAYNSIDEAMSYVDEAMA